MNSIYGTADSDILNGDTNPLDLNDQMFGQAGDDHLSGLTGDDTLDGGEGADVLEGGEGNDTLTGGMGADSLIGGAGDDLYYVDNSADVVTEQAGEGTDTVQSSVSYTLADNIENLTFSNSWATGLVGTGNELDNVLTAHGSYSTLNGGFGNDTLISKGNQNTLNGGAGDDMMVANERYSVLNGDDGNDTLNTELCSSRTKHFLS